MEFKQKVGGIEFIFCLAFSCLYIFKEIIMRNWHNKETFMQLPIVLK